MTVADRGGGGGREGRDVNEHVKGDRWIDRQGQKKLILD